MKQSDPYLCLDLFFMCSDLSNNNLPGFLPPSFRDLINLQTLYVVIIPKSIFYSRIEKRMLFIEKKVHDNDDDWPLVRF